MSSGKILYVDDEQNVLDACRRSLGRKLDITTANSGAEGLALIRKDGPFAVVLSDMRMPQMDGVEFICAVRQQSPDTVCMMLTGNSDQETAMNAVNKGQIFRFLTKPCDQDVLHGALQAGIKQHRLITAEKELLQNTLTGSIRALVDVLSLVNPKAFARSNRVRQIVKVMVKELGLEHPWQYDIAAMLSQLGCIVLPPNVIDKVFSGKTLRDEEREMFESHPTHGKKLISHIPRMYIPAKIIERQLQRYDAVKSTGQDGGDSVIKTGAQILHAALGFEAHMASGLGRVVATTKMRDSVGEYDPALVDVLTTTSIPEIDDATQGTVEELTVRELKPGMYAHTDILTPQGNLLVVKGSEITQPIIDRLKNFSRGVGIVEPIQALVPTS